MKDFRIDDIIRYLITGAWIFFLLNQNNTEYEYINYDKEFLVILISFSIGAVAYTVFRTFLYPLLQMALDLIISENTGRNYLKNKYRIKNWCTRNDLWILFQVRNIKKFYGNYSIWLSSFLTMYTLSISTFIAILFGDYDINEIFIYSAICVILFIGGALSNIKYEKRLFNNTVFISEPTLKEFVKDYLEKRISIRHD